MLEVCDEDQMGYINEELRIVTGPQKVLRKCNNDNGDDDDEGVSDDSDNQGPLR